MEELTDNQIVFYDAECYILLYEYQRSSIIYFWQGNKATVKEKGLCGQIAKDLNTTINGNARLVRVEEGSEPRHFLSLLKGRMVVFEGKKAATRKDISMFQLRGVNHGDMKTLECFVSSYFLYSSDIFFLKTSEAVYIWFGHHCVNTLRNTASQIASLIAPDVNVVSVEEGTEPEEFWEKIGGKKEYVPHEKNKTRLWVCENVNKTYKCYEYNRFNQSELTYNRQAILDRHSEVKTNVFVFLFQFNFIHFIRFLDLCLVGRRHTRRRQENCH